MSEKIENIYHRPLELLQQLIRFDTSNPPGNEKPCIDYLNELLLSAGIETTVLSKAPNRPNLVARIKGGNASPLLLYGHIDVVPPGSGEWKYPPFEGRIEDGFLWGRGALDMKAAVAMMVCAFLKAKIENHPLPGDVVLCLLSDEEAFGEYGAQFLVENHPHLFEGVKYALGEFGGFNLNVGGKTFYPIEVAQKQKCGIKATLRGPSGHGSSYIKGGAMAKLGEMLTKLDQNFLPVHITPAVEMMFSTMAQNLSFPASAMMRQLLKSGRTDFVLKILGEKGKAFIPMFHNTVNATMVKGGDQLNVIPDQIEVQMDARLLPGSAPDQLLEELRALLGENVQLDVLLYDEGPAEPDMALFDTLAQIIKEADPEGIPVPMLLTACSDARFFSRLGIQTYGFTPMQLPPDMNFSRTIHSVNERIPVDAVTFGTKAMFQAIVRGT